MASITTDEARHVASLPRSQGRLQLLTYLERTAINEDVDLREAIHLDYLYDNLMSAVAKGFSWAQVCAVLSSAETLLEGTKGKSMVEAIQLYQKLSESLLSVLGERNFKIYTDFVFSTFMTHYKLFQYVFNQPRAEQAPQLDKVVEVPISPPKLKDATQMNIWEYEQRYQTVETKEIERANQMQEDLQRLAGDSTELSKKTNEELGGINSPLNKESVARIIQEVVKSSTVSVTEKLKVTISHTMDDLQFKLERTIIPRPQVLGPPPRFNPKTPIQTARPPPVEPVVPVASKVEKAEKAEKPRSKSRNSARSVKSAKSSKS